MVQCSFESPIYGLLFRDPTQLKLTPLKVSRNLFSHTSSEYIHLSQPSHQFSQGDNFENHNRTKVANMKGNCRDRYYNY